MLQTTDVKQLLGGKIVKQTDKSSPFSFLLLDSQKRKVPLNGEAAEIVLYTSKGKYWETSSKVSDGVVNFQMPGNLSVDNYKLEISVAGYVFPSKEDFIITVVQGFKELPSKESAESIKKTTVQVIKEEAEKAVRELGKTELKGEKGEKGDRGETGETGKSITITNTTKQGKDNIISFSDQTTLTIKDGLDGKTGPEGKQGEIGPKGEPFRYEDFTEEQLASLKGPKGDAFTYDDFTEDQLASLKGERGERGPEGQQGIQGKTGDKGDVGPKGDQGPQGPKGADGVMSFEALTDEQKESLKGDVGPQGKEGPPGPEGPQGKPGERGPAGETGPTGPQGPEGPPGEVGPQGKDGPPGPQGQPGKDAEINLESISKLSQEEKKGIREQLNVPSKDEGGSLNVAEIRRIAAEVAFGSYLFTQGDGLSENLNNFYNTNLKSDIKNLSNLVASDEAMKDLASNAYAMSAVINSSTAMSAVINSSTAMSAVAASSTAMSAVAASSTAMSAVAASSTAMNAVKNNVSKWTKGLSKQSGTFKPSSLKTVQKVPGTGIYVITRVWDQGSVVDSCTLYSGPDKNIKEYYSANNSSTDTKGFVAVHSLWMENTSSYNEMNINYDLYTGK